MSKNLLQDMVKVRRTPVSGVRRVQMPKEDTRPDPEKLEVHKGRQVKHKTRYMLWFVAFLSILFFLFALSYLFLKVVVTVNPKIQNVVLNKNLSASKDGGADVLPFDLIVISGEDTTTVQTTETKDLLEKAQGVIIVYNTFGYAPQRLDIDTRLEGSNGKIYKTQKQIIVPGMKGKTPGSVEVGIYASNAGPEYNSIPLDFTVLGFKGTPKYSKFYARSKGDIAGGFKGKTPIISDAQKLNTINGLKIALQAKLFKKATDQIPSGFILFKNATFLNTDDSNIEAGSPKDNTLLVTIKGTLYGLLFDESKLTKKIAQDGIQNYDDSDVYLPNIRDLDFSLTNQDSTSFGDVKKIDFSLKGTTKIVWKLDESKLITDLLGKSRKDFNSILLQYPNVDSADLVVSPFWKMSIPDKAKDIKIIVNYPK